MRQQNKYLSTAGVKCANHGEHFGMFKQLTTPAIAIFDLHAKFSLDIKINRLAGVTVLTRNQDGGCRNIKFR